MPIIRLRPVVAENQIRLGGHEGLQSRGIIRAPRHLEQELFARLSYARHKAAGDRSRSGAHVSRRPMSIYEALGEEIRSASVRADVGLSQGTPIHVDRSIALRPDPVPRQTDQALDEVHGLSFTDSGNDCRLRRMKHNHRPTDGRGVAIQEGVDRDPVLLPQGGNHRSGRDPERLDDEGPEQEVDDRYNAGHLAK